MGELHPIQPDIHESAPTATTSSERTQPVRPPLKHSLKSKPASKVGTKKAQRSKPIRVLPTDRIAFPKQLDILRAYASIYASTQQPVSHQKVAEVSKMQPSTVSLANPFLASINLIEKTDAGYIPCTDAMAFQRAYNWNPETAGRALQPVVRSSWFAQTMLARVSYAPVQETEAVEILAHACSAGPEYKLQIRCLLEYLAHVGLIERDGGQVRTVKTNGQDAEGEQSQTTQRSPIASTEKSDMTSSPRIATAYTQFPEGAVQFNVSIKVGMAEFGGWSPERIAAFFSGLAQVLAAKADIEQKP
jgi:hypothetical protein